MILFCLTVDTLLKNFKEQNIGLSITGNDKLGNVYDEYIGWHMLMILQQSATNLKLMKQFKYQNNELISFRNSRQNSIYDMELNKFVNRKKYHY